MHGEVGHVVALPGDPRSPARASPPRAAQRAAGRMKHGCSCAPGGVRESRTTIPSGLRPASGPLRLHRTGVPLDSRNAGGPRASRPGLWIAVVGVRDAQDSTGMRSTEVGGPSSSATPTPEKETMGGWQGTLASHQSASLVEHAFAKDLWSAVAHGARPDPPRLAEACDALKR